MFLFPTESGGGAASQANKEEVDARSIFVGNVRTEKTFDIGYFISKNVLKCEISDFMILYLNLITNLQLSIHLNFCCHYLFNSHCFIYFNCTYLTEKYGVNEDIFSPVQ